MWFLSVVEGPIVIDFSDIDEQIPLSFLFVREGRWDFFIFSKMLVKT